MFKLGKMIETFADKTPVAVLVRAVLQRELDTNAWTGLLANLSTLAEIQRWAEIHFSQLRKFLEFKNKKGKRRVPHAITLARLLRKLSLDDLQTAFAAFLNDILDDSPLAAAGNNRQVTSRSLKKGLCCHSPPLGEAMGGRFRS